MRPRRRPATRRPPEAASRCARRRAAPTRARCGATAGRRDWHPPRARRPESAAAARSRPGPASPSPAGTPSPRCRRWSPAGQPRATPARRSRSGRSRWRESTAPRSTGPPRRRRARRPRRRRPSSPCRLLVSAAPGSGGPATGTGRNIPAGGIAPGDQPRAAGPPTNAPSATRERPSIRGSASLQVSYRRDEARGERRQPHGRTRPSPPGPDRQTSAPACARSSRRNGRRTPSSVRRSIRRGGQPDADTPPARAGFVHQPPPVRGSGEPGRVGARPLRASIVDRLTRAGAARTGRRPVPVPATGS